MNGLSAQARNVALVVSAALFMQISIARAVQGIGGAPS